MSLCSKYNHDRLIRLVDLLPEPMEFGTNQLRLTPRGGEVVYTVEPIMAKISSILRKLDIDTIDITSLPARFGLLVLRGYAGGLIKAGYLLRLDKKTTVVIWVNDFDIPTANEYSQWVDKHVVMTNLKEKVITPNCIHSVL